MEDELILRFLDKLITDATRLKKELESKEKDYMGINKIKRRLK